MTTCIVSLNKLGYCTTNHMLHYTNPYLFVVQAQMLKLHNCITQINLQRNHELHLPEQRMQLIKSTSQL